ncbi:MAG: 4Fe-4S dicluster domain-containing protein [Bacillota bacterium]
MKLKRRKLESVETLVITFQEMARFCLKLSEEHSTYFPIHGAQGYSQWQRLTREINCEDVASQVFTVNSTRALHPVKAFFAPIRRKVTTYKITWNEASLEEETSEELRVLFGVRACDLASLKILDSVFEGSPCDPPYSFIRDRTILVSADCVTPQECCFCLSVGGAPYAVKGFDLNITPIGAEFLVEVGSQKGSDLARKFLASFEKPSEVLVRAREEQRKSSSKSLAARGFFSPDADRKTALEQGTGSSTWYGLVSKCVECHACSHICPTCYCFLLNDEITEESVQRLALWDSCLRTGFARVAGGANPRKDTLTRLMHRYFHKFVYLPDRSSVEGCTGCGRCIEACPGGIDVREVLGKLINEAEKGEVANVSS